MGLTLDGRASSRSTRSSDSSSSLIEVPREGLVATLLIRNNLKINKRKNQQQNKPVLRYWCWGSDSMTSCGIGQEQFKTSPQYSPRPISTSPPEMLEFQLVTGAPKKRAHHQRHYAAGMGTSRLWPVSQPPDSATPEAKQIQPRNYRTRTPQLRGPSAQQQRHLH